MPGQFLTPADRERLSHFPASISENDLAVYFTLSSSDRELIGSDREPHTRLGFALMLCALRYLGFFPINITRAPESAVEYLAEQFHVAPEALSAYGGRAETRREHLPPIMAHLGFRRVDAPERGRSPSGWWSAR
jgi:TnpA family transposase